MGLDGFSMSNLGLHRNLTTAQLANEVDAVAKQTLESQIKDVDGIGKKEKAGKKDPEAAFNGMVPFIPDEDKEDASDENANQQNTETFIDKSVGDDNSELEEETEIEEPQFLFKMSSDNMIEIYDKKTGQVIKKITPEEAATTVHNFTKLPSIFFNRNI